ncbi:acetyl-CoA carboxylase biotin carboxyl carrier protein [soil metagenome]
MRERANALVGELLERLGRDGVRELEVRRDGMRVRVEAGSGPTSAPPALAAASPAPLAAAGTPQPPAEARTVNAPLTGIFYRASSPQAPPLVQVGSVIAAGDVIGLIEAMKLFNEIRSTATGRVKRVIADNGQLVRAHQPLLELE